VVLGGALESRDLEAGEPADPHAALASPMLAELAFSTTVLAYAAACALFFAHLARRGASGRLARAARWHLGIAAGCHGAWIALASLGENVCPVGSIHFLGSVAAFFASILYLGLWKRARLEALGVFVAPVALTFVLGSRFVETPERHMTGAFVALHVLVNLLGEAFFLLACGAAVLYLLQEKQLKQKRGGGWLGRLPSLEALDRAAHKFLLSGFPLLTIGIVSGTVWAGRLENGTPAEIARAAFGYGTWLLFGAVLVLRAAAGWRGRKAAYGTIAGFVLALTVLVMYLVRGGGV